MSAVTEVSLGNVVNLNPTFSGRSAAPDEVVDFLPMSAINEVETRAVATECRALVEVQRGYTNFSDGDVLLAKITPCFENGKIAQVTLKHKYGFGSTEFHVLRAHSDKLDSRYLVHFLRRDQVRIDGQRKMTGSAGQRRVPKHFLESLPIRLPSLSEQRRIAAILDQADALRAKRREVLAQLDSLTHSIFIEMFGDPATNPKGWPVHPIGNLLDGITNGLTRRRSESDQGSDIVLRLREIRSGWIDFSEVNRITLEPNEMSRFLVTLGDLLFIRVNGNPDYVGRCATFEGYSEPVYFNDHVMRVKIDKTRIHRRFLAFALNGRHGKAQIAKHRKTSAGQHTINQLGLSKIELPIPPIRLQTAFAERMQGIIDHQALYERSQTELAFLFASLQHRAFRGEL